VHGRRCAVLCGSPAASCACGVLHPIPSGSGFAPCRGAEGGACWQWTWEGAAARPPESLIAGAPHRPGRQAMSHPCAHCSWVNRPKEPHFRAFHTHVRITPSDCSRLGKLLPARHKRNIGPPLRHTPHLVWWRCWGDTTAEAKAWECEIPGSSWWAGRSGGGDQRRFQGLAVQRRGWWWEGAWQRVAPQRSGRADETAGSFSAGP
jgi:hypothetical protein